MNDKVYKWNRISIEKEQLKKFSERSDSKGLLQSILHLFIWLVTGTISYLFFKIDNLPGFFLFLSIHGIVGSHFLHAHHELSHGTVFKTKYLNEIFLKIFSLFGLLNYHIYQLSHLQHHQKTCHTNKDFEVVLPRKPSLNLFFLIQLFSINIFCKGGLIQTLKNLIKISLNKFDNPMNAWSEELFTDKPLQREKARNWARFVLLFHVFITFVSLSLGEPVLILLITLHVFICRWHHYFLNETQHTGLQSNTDDFRKCTRTILINPISSFLYWHMNWHIEHHMYTSIPFYNLKSIHELIKHEMPKPRTLLEAWIEMYNTSKVQNKNKDYYYNTIMPNN